MRNFYIIARAAEGCPKAWRSSRCRRPIGARAYDERARPSTVANGGREPIQTPKGILVSEAEFDEIFARIVKRGMSYWADPFRRKRAANATQSTTGMKGVACISTTQAAIFSRSSIHAEAAHYRRIGHVKLIDAIPKSLSGKFLRRVLGNGSVGAPL